MLEFFYARVEVKKREFISRLELATEFLRHGVTVLIGDQASDGEIESVSCSPGYYFGKCAQDSTLSTVKSLVEKGWICGALDEEGLLPNDLESFANQRFSIKCGSYFSDLFFFGPAQKCIFDLKYPMVNNFAFGNPRIDAWHNNLYGIHDELATKLKLSLQDFYLFPLNYSYYTNNALRNKSRLSRSASAVKDLSLRSEFLFDKVCKLTQLWTSENNVRIILRPHPADDPTNVKRLMAHHGVSSATVICDARFEVFPWIKASRGVIHNCCTTSLEAGFADKTVASFVPDGISLYEDSIVNDLFPKFSDNNLLINYFAKSDLYQGDIFLSRLKQWDRLELDYLGSSSAYIAETLLAKYSFRTRSEASFRPSVKAFGLDLARKFRSSFGGSSRKVFSRKFPSLSPGEVSRALDKILSFKGIKNDFLCYTVGPKLVAITPR